MAMLLILLSALWRFGPGMIDTESFKNQILTDISRKINGKTQLKKVDFSFFPWPHLRIHKGNLSISGKVDAVFESVSIFPEILPLFKGRLRASKILINSPDVTLYMPKRDGRESKRQNFYDFAAQGRTVISRLGFFTSKDSSLVFAVENGILNLKKGNEYGIQFEDVQIQIECPPKEFKVDLNCRSSSWQSLSLMGSLNPDTLSSQGQLKLKHFQLQVLTDYLFPDSTLRVGDSRLNLDLEFNTVDTDNLRAEFKGTIPYLALHRGKEKFVVKGKDFKGIIQKNGDRVGVFLNELDLDAPRLHLSGNLQMDRLSPRIRLESEGKEVDIDSIRQAVLFAVGDSPGMQKVFGTVKGGRLPSVTVHSKGNVLNDLSKLENLAVKGRLVDGSAWIPQADLNLEEITGDIVISRGVLEGERLSTRLGNSKGHRGKLKLGLSGSNAPFYLDMALNADLSQIPPILKRVWKNGPFAEEIDLVDDLRGDAIGKLVLNRSTSSVEFTLDISKFNLSARYRRLPYPLTVHGEQFFYDKDRVMLENLTGRLGQTSFLSLSADVDMGRTPQVRIKSGTLEIVLAEIYPWLLSFDTLKDALKSYNAASGRIGLSSLDLKGPLFDPGQWHFQVDGKIHNLAVRTSFLKGGIALSRGEFSAIPESLSFKNVQSKMLDASLNGSGIINGYLKELQKADVTLQGNMGLKMIQKISDLIRLPSALRFRSPLSVSNAHLIWRRDGKTDFTGSMAVKEGPDISMEMVFDSGELMIKHLRVQDKASRALAAFAFSDNALGLNFKGNLDKSTLDRLLVRNPFLTGWIKGDFKARILMDQPLHSRIWGTFQGEGIAPPWMANIPIQIESVSLDSNDNRLEVKSALLTWEEQRLALSGTLNATAEIPWIDFSLWTDVLEWDKIEKLLKQKPGKERNSQIEKMGWDLPLRGNLRIEAENFKYEQYVWSPFIADVAFGQDGMSANIAEANLCGISFPGKLKFTPQEIQLDFKQIARNQEVADVVPCLVDKKGIVSGRFDFDGTLTAKGEKETLNRNLHGDLKFNAFNGRIYRSSVLKKILALLNVYKIIRGDFSEFSQKGFTYDSINIGGEIKNGKVRLNEITLVSPSMNIVGDGEIGIIDKKLDIKIWVAPLKMVNRVIGKIPGIRRLTGENPISIPMKVSGDVGDPKVSLFSN